MLKGKCHYKVAGNVGDFAQADQQNDPAAERKLRYIFICREAGKQ